MKNNRISKCRKKFNVKKPQTFGFSFSAQLYASDQKSDDDH